MYIATLDQTTAGDPSRFGAKTARLAQLLRLGVPVLPGTAVSGKALERHIRANGDLRRLYQAAAETGPGDLSLPRRLTDVQQAILDAPLPDDLADELAAMVVDSEARVIVRSSAMDEDGAVRSHAGAYVSIPNVRGWDRSELERALRRVWASYFVPRGEKTHGLRADGMGVLVQPHLVSECGGVMFSRDPLHPANESVLIEAIRGQVSQLVSGRAPTIRLRVGRAAPREVTVLGGDLPDASFEWNDLAALAMDIEDTLGFAVDVEWARCGGRFFVLQARPVTALPSSELGAPIRFVSADDDAACSEVDLREVRQIHTRWMSKKYWIRQAAQRADVSSPAAYYLFASRQALSDGSSDDALQLPTDLRSPYLQVDSAGSPARIVARQDLSSILREHLADDDVHAVRIRDYLPNESAGFATVLNDGTTLIEYAPGGMMGIGRGEVAPSRYILAPDGSVLEQHQADTCWKYMLDARTREFGKVAHVAGPLSLTDEQIARVHHLAETFEREFGRVRLEWFCWQSRIYLFDATLERSDIRFAAGSETLSPGGAMGTVLVIDDDLATELDVLGEAINISVRHTQENEAAAQMEPVRELQRRIAAIPGDVVLVVGLAINTYSLVLDRVVGVVCETGAVLSHLAICLREAETPSIVIPDARSRFHTGDRIQILASGGYRILEPSGVKPVSA